ncbi:MAG: CTP synthase, partial [Melioribacteraceae bacterium]|nr:CTP synthase [Melioribacteraceae bacterium]
NINLDKWKGFVEKVKNPSSEVNIAVCGKYTDLFDAYKSIDEAFIHAGAENDVKVNVKYLSTEKITENNASKILSDYDGVLIPGGFGERGIEGKIEAIRFVRENNIPFFGICLGLQCAVIEYARNVSNLKNANSTEFAKTRNSVIHLMPEQLKVKLKGGSMRLGAYPCTLAKGTKAFKAYKKEKISERHRHRYEVNNKFIPQLVKDGLVISGKSPDKHLVEMIELEDHPWFVGCQFHPELKSRAVKAHPLFREFVKAAVVNKKNKAAD